MKLFSSLLPLAALTTAFVIPDDQTMSQVTIETNRDANKDLYEKLPSKHQIYSEVDEAISSSVEFSKNAFDRAVEYAGHTAEDVPKKCHAAADTAKSWIDSASSRIDTSVKELGLQGHPGHHDKPNMTVYELIANSKYTTKLAALINEYPDLVTLLNGTTANFTVFAPIDRAFEKIPEHAPKPSKDEIKQILFYHISKDFYPAGRVLLSHTIPTYLVGDGIGGEAQRVSVNIGLRGLTVNFYSRIIAIDIFGTNGVIHGVDSLLLLPPKAASIIEYLPGEFSTLELGLTKTGLFKVINDTSNHVGGTLFAPSNFAFQKLGPRLNGFLFSKYGQKYLKALLKYHVVANQTLYSDAYYKTSAQDAGATGLPQGYFHIDLPTLLEDKSLSVDVGRYGRIISIKINAFATVTISDGIAEDGVIHVVDNVLIPPKSIDGPSEQWQGEEISEDDLKTRLEPFVEAGEL